MSVKELKRLRRSDLLEMLLDLTRENDALREEVRILRGQLESRKITIRNCGSLAEAAMQLNGVFEAAQAACQQYTENIRDRSENLELHCKQMEEQTRKRCEQMIAEAKAEAQRYAEEAKRTGEPQDPAETRLADSMDNGEK